MKSNVFNLLAVVFIVLALAGAPATYPTQAQELGPLGGRVGLAPQGTALGTAFTYQGRLTDTTGNPVAGPCILRFSLYQSAANNDPVGAPQTANGVMPDNGYFTVALDFGADAFSGEGRFLKIEVDCGSGSFTPLDPRVELTPAPYALYAVSTGALRGNPVSDSAPTSGDVLAWDGNSWLPTVPSGGTGNAWSLTGNSGTTPGTNFLGTTDNQALQLHVNGVRALRLEPHATSPNFIGGYSGNSVTAGKFGATIGGGGQSGSPNRVTWDLGTVGGGHGNTASSSGATVGGGSDNTASGYLSIVGGGGANIASIDAATISGGWHNTATVGFGATVGGGQYNTASDLSATVGGGAVNTASGAYATVGGGYNNTASGGDAATVGGGSNNIASGYSATIGGGGSNTASNNSATIGGGDGNAASGGTSTIGGGYFNVSSGDYSYIGGGYLNAANGGQATIGGGALNAANGSQATIGGGALNAANGSQATIGGGKDNTISAISPYATIGGGLDNTAGSQATVGGGWINDAIGHNATIGGGLGNAASGSAATIAGGNGNAASSGAATVGGGLGNIASGLYASVPGGQHAQASLYGQVAYAGGMFNAAGDAQASLYVMRTTTNNGTGDWNDLYLDGSSALLTIADGRTLTFDILVVGRSNAGESAGYYIWGVAENVGGTTTVWATTMVLQEDDATWDVQAIADDANDALTVQAMGNGEIIRWVATVRTTEVAW